MDKETIEQITNYLDKIGEKLGVGAQKVWPWLVKQQYVDSLSSVAFLILSSLIFVWGVKLHKKVEDWENFSPQSILVVTLLVVGTIGTLISIINFCNQFPNIFNPEYWALKDVLRMIRR